VSAAADAGSAQADGGGAERVRIFDSTLRDGEQAPGCTMTCEEKLEVARQLHRLGVDIIEAGFPAASPGDWEAVREIAESVGRSEGAPVICGLARANPADIEKCATAIAPARHRRIHTFIATSDLHLEHKLRMTRAQVLDTARRMVALARGCTPDVEFSPEDASRSDREFLYEVLAAAIEAGATTLNIPDTVGYATPEEYGALIAGIRERVPGARGVILSAHCHDDLGLAVANSLAAVRAGARQVECTINGVGERAGNAALEEVVMALHTRRAHFGVDTDIHTREIGRASRLVAQCTGIRTPPNKAVVGGNAFAHEAGIHQDGILKHRGTYEIMSAELVGLEGGRLVLGKHSGRHALRRHLETMGHHLTEEELSAVFTRFKEVADRKKVVDDRDLEALVHGEARRTEPLYRLELVQVSTGTHAIPTATVRLVGPEGNPFVAAAQGDGPVDAVCRAINDVVGDVAELVEFGVDAVTEGINAVGGVTVRLRATGAPAAHTHPQDTLPREVRYTGFAAHTDILVATAEAYVNALNTLLRARTAPRTLAHKLWDAHVVRPESADAPAILYVDLHLVHEVTSAQAFDELRVRGLPVRRPDRTLATMDHSTPTRPVADRRQLAVLDPQAARQLDALRANCDAFGIRLHDLGDEERGIVHVIGPEGGHTLPGMTIVCGDSHTSTHGAFGALAFGIGTSEVADVLATQCLLQARPRTMEVRVEGALGEGVTAKDLVLAIIAQVGVAGGAGHVVEYTGPAIRALDMEGRMTVCNMSIELGARAGLIAPDDTTFAWLKGRPHAPRGAAWDTAVARWRAFRSDPAAPYDRTVVVDASAIAPMVTYGTNPGMAIPVTAAIPAPEALEDATDRAQHAQALAYMGLDAGRPIAGQKVDVVFIGSCTNSRLGDLRAAAQLLRGRRIAPDVRMLVVPGSQAVKRKAEAEGLDRVFRDAGAEWRESGCSMCIAMNGDQLAPGEYAVSTSNRNFEGRQGKGGRTFLASPATAAASALTGRITDPRPLLAGRPAS
jgi:3-isopropylmalate/(R)-2-methylmalate dehydratase large subunit